MNDISHEKARALINKAADANLSDQESALLIAHLDRCTACQAYQQELESLQTTIRSTLHRRVMHHSNRAPKPMRTKQSAHLTQQLRRNIRMKNA